MAMRFRGASSASTHLAGRSRRTTRKRVSHSRIRPFAAESRARKPGGLDPLPSLTNGPRVAVCDSETVLRSPQPAEMPRSARRKSGSSCTPSAASASRPPSSRSSTQSASLDDQTGCPQRLDRRDQRAARGDDVLDHEHALARLEHALDAALGAVLLGRPCARSGTGCRVASAGAAASGTAPSSGPASRSGAGSLAAASSAERLADRPEQRRIGLEAVLVEVDGRALARAQDEIAVQQRALGDAARELLARHRPVAASASAASGSSRSASGAPCASESIEPSSK